MEGKLCRMYSLFLILDIGYIFVWTCFFLRDTLS